MKSNLLKSKMVLKGDTLASLSKILDCTIPTLCNKMNGHRPFKAEEIKIISDHYQLTNKEIKEIFLG